jgi:hypothetical protein
MKQQRIESSGRFGLVYRTWHMRNGVLLQDETTHNLVPDEGITDILGVYFKGVTAKANWYVFLYEGNYTPDGSETGGTIAAVATEFTAYTPNARPLWVSGPINAGSLDNVAARAVFKATAKKTLYGGGIHSSSVKGGTSGMLPSCVRFGSPKVLDIGDELAVAAGIAFTSAP